jgi:hypothetical protein
VRDFAGLPPGRRGFDLDARALVVVGVIACLIGIEIFGP